MKRYYKIEGSNKEVKVYTGYSLGGPNYFTGTMNPRGYYLHVAVVERQDHCETVTLFDNSSFKVMLLEVIRQSKRRAEEAEVLALQVVDEYVQALASRNNITVLSDFEEL